MLRLQIVGGECGGEKKKSCQESMISAKNMFWGEI